MIMNQKKSNGKISEEMMIDDIGIFFNAGSDTITKAIEVAIYFLALYPNIQETIYAELKSCINAAQTEESFFKLQDQFNAATLRAFVHETIRFHGMSVVTPARTCMKDTYIKHNEQKYLIPQNSIIVASIVGINLNTETNQKIFGKNVHKFDINHFLDQKTKKFQSNNLFPTFSFGRRDCAGRSFAMNQILSIVGNLVLTYQFKPYKKDYEQFEKDL
eukprot:UN05398